MKAHFTYEVQMDLAAAEWICSLHNWSPPYKNNWFIITPRDNDDTEAFATVVYPQEGLSLSDFFIICGQAMEHSNHPWTQFTTRCHMDDKGCSLWDTIGKHGYHQSEGYYNAKSLGISSHEKLERIKDILNEHPA